MSAQSFVGQSAIVTGAGQGIGYEIARQLALNGASVLLNDIDEKLASTAAQRINKEGGNVFAMSGDASLHSFIQDMVKEASSRFGKLTIAVANAGITLFGDFFDFTPESFQRVMQVNLAGTFFLAQTAGAQMKKQGEGGSILFMSSATGHQAHKNLAAYATTKAGIEMLAKNLVIELSKFHININAIAPGATLTERTREDIEYEKTWSRLNPTGRASTVEEVAHAALFLLSPSSRQITGQTLIIDGGWSSVSPSPF
jgi:glucose 1-dehydrogenase